MKNITVTVPDEVYRGARIAAAELGASVSALVTGYLERLADTGGEFRRLEAQQERIFDSIAGFRANGRLSRDESHERAALR
ncbi:MAG: hypothetical protein J7480_01570 [Microbacteriaceae bacterium]|nr:hypothetical protein [Microbacteriaceae bacterium]